MWNRLDMSVIWPVPQSEMLPYVAAAAFGLDTHSFTAVWSSSLLVNM